MSDIITGFCD